MCLIWVDLSVGRLVCLFNSASVVNSTPLQNQLCLVFICLCTISIMVFRFSMIPPHVPIFIFFIDIISARF